MSENFQQESTATTGATGERSPEELEREIAGTRASIDSTVGELGQRLNPRQLAEDARDYVRETATRGASNAWIRISESTREHAVPILLIGSGVAWYMWSGRDEQGYGRSYGQQPYSGRIGEGDAGEGMVSGMVSRTGEAARHATQRVRESTSRLGSRLGSRAQDGLGRAKDGLEHVRRDQPLLLGLASVALGALVGGAIPNTRRENEMLGDVRERALDKVAEVGRQTAEQMRHAGEDARQGRSGNGGEAHQQGSGDRPQGAE